MATNRPPPGTMVYWRFKDRAPCPFVFGYCTYVSGSNMVRMGCWNGDTTLGPVVDVNEIDWRKHP